MRELEEELTRVRECGQREQDHQLQELERERYTVRSHMHSLGDKIRKLIRQFLLL